jgi:hypothetical protein
MPEEDTTGEHARTAKPTVPEDPPRNDALAACNSYWDSNVFFVVETANPGAWISSDTTVALDPVADDPGRLDTGE